MTFLCKCTAIEFVIFLFNHRTKQGFVVCCDWIWWSFGILWRWLLTSKSDHVDRSCSLGIFWRHRCWVEANKPILMEYVAVVIFLVNQTSCQWLWTVDHSKKSHTSFEKIQRIAYKSQKTAIKISKSPIKIPKNLPEKSHKNTINLSILYIIFKVIYPRMAACLRFLEFLTKF